MSTSSGLPGSTAGYNALQASLGMNAMNDPTRPIWKEDSSCTEFLREYRQWTHRWGWTEEMRVSSLPSFVPEKYSKHVKRMMLGPDLTSYTSWENATKVFRDAFGMSPEDMATKINTLKMEYSSESSRQKPNEPVRDFELRFVELVSNINSTIRELNGPEPEHPDKILLDALDSTRSTGLVPTTLSFGGNTKITSTPSKLALLSAIARPGEKAAEIAERTNLIMTAKKSDAYIKADAKYSAWLSKRRQQISDSEACRNFSGKFNKKYQHEVSIRFMSEQETSIKEISKFAARLERLNREEQARKHVSFPDQSAQDQTLDQLKKEITLLRQQHKLQNDEIKAMAKSRLNAGTINAAHAQMHPARALMVSQAQQYNQQQATNTYPAMQATAETCLLCNQTGHLSHDCPSKCIKCGGTHNASACQLDRETLMCTKCGRKGHLSNVCINSLRDTSHKRPRNQGGRGRGKRRSVAQPCFHWEKGPCSFGDRCIFQHNGPQGGVKKQKQVQNPTPPPIPQNVAPMAPIWVPAPTQQPYLYPSPYQQQQQLSQHPQFLAMQAQINELMARGNSGQEATDKVTSAVLADSAPNADIGEANQD